MKKNYELALSKVCDYISTHLESKLTLDELSAVANISKFHFHRLFSANMSISIYTYIQMQRFKRASYQLVFNRDLKIVDIALDANFEGPEAFTRSFKNTFGVTPSQFRKNPDWYAWHEKYKFHTKTQERRMEVKIIDFKRTNIAVLEHHGAPEFLNDTIPKFIEWRKKTGLSPIDKCRTFGIVYNDPENTPPDEFRFDVCAEIYSDVIKNDHGIIQKTIASGRCAVVRHLGSHDTIGVKIYALYRDWLPDSGLTLRNAPLFFQYHNFFPEVAESELITDIFLPIN